MRGLLGKKLSHSFSKLIHEKLDNHKYNLIEKDSIDSFLLDKAFSGINVTIPYKKDVIRYLDNASDIVLKTGSCNTIINDNGKLKGFNTDYDGFDFLIKTNQISIENKTVAILGNGSTSRTVKLYCELKCAKEVKVFARSPKKTEYNIKDIHTFRDIDILINATPVGMYPNNTASLGVELAKLVHCTTVIDLIYNPLRTMLLLDAEAHDRKAVNGLVMLVHQAVKANELFNNISHPQSVTLKLYKEIYHNMLNIVLIGMPMCGKSYYARQLNDVYDKDILDIDSIIEVKAKLSIPEIFSNLGEVGFREIENSVIKDISILHNKAISTGGGVILNSYNISLLKQNGVLIFLDMPLESLKKCNPKNRPLLQDSKNLEKLFNARYHLYKNYADIIVDKRGFKRYDTLRKIEVKLNEYINS